MKTEQEILDLNDPYKSWWYCSCHRDVTDINISLHEQIIIKSKNARYCYLFARDVKQSNKQLLSKAVLLSGDLYFIKKFYEKIDFDKEKYKTLMMFL